MKKIFLEVIQSKGKKAKAYCFDISRLGIGFVSSCKPKTGTVVQIRPQSKALPVMQAKIAHSLPYRKRPYKHRVGAKFIYLTVQQRVFLEKFIRKVEKAIYGN